jgi:pectate lyase
MRCLGRLEMVPMTFTPAVRGRLLGAALVLALASTSSAAVPAFPGAEGFGVLSVGGRGGRVIEVTNLNDSGDGSLRQALEASGPRIVVFRVAGTIELLSEIVVTNSFLTVAGQTAPGGGITLKTHPSNHRSALTIKGASDVVIRHIRSRPGPHAGLPRGVEGEVKDAIQILDSQRVILDHCSSSWATDEVVSTFFASKDVTIQWCIIAEALRKARSDQDLPGKGLLIGSKGAERITVHHNLMAHNIGRNPLIKADGVVDVVNNVVLAPANVAMAISAETGRAAANFVGNNVLAPSGDGLVYGMQAIGPPPFAMFVRDNLGPHRKDLSQREEMFVSPNNEARRWIVAARHEAPAISTTSAQEALEIVLTQAGCTRPLRDAVDERIVADVRAGRARLVDDPQEVGGWPQLDSGEASLDRDHDGMPDVWEKTNSFAVDDPADGSDDADGDGYTNVEEFLNGTNPKAADR